MALARVWQWERTVKEELPRVVAEGDIKTLFQPIYRLGDGFPVVGGYEALSRFPVAPRIPVALWFRTARDSGLTRELEMAAVRSAVAYLPRVPEGAFLCVNSSLDSIPDLIEIIPSAFEDRLIIDLPYSTLRDTRGEAMLEVIRHGVARLAFDDVPLEDLHTIRPLLMELRPDCIKVDVLTGLTGSAMARFNLAAGSAWCQEIGIRLIAERVERIADVAVLDAVGVEWAQGYCLSRPVEL